MDKKITITIQFAKEELEVYRKHAKAKYSLTLQNMIKMMLKKETNN